MLELHPLDGRTRQGGLVLDETGLAFGLRDVHRDIRVADQLIRRLLARDQAGDADAGAYRDLLATNGEGWRELPRDPLGDAPGDLLVLHLLQQDRESGTAQPRDRVPGSQRRRDPR